MKERGSRDVEDCAASGSLLQTTFVNDSGRTLIVVSSALCRATGSTRQLKSVGRRPVRQHQLYRRFVLHGVTKVKCMNYEQKVQERLTIAGCEPIEKSTSPHDGRCSSANLSEAAVATKLLGRES